MSGMGETIADFLKGLFWLIGILAGVVVVLLGIIVWLVLE